MTDNVTHGGSHTSPTRPVPNDAKDETVPSLPHSSNVNQGRSAKRRQTEKAALIQFHLAEIAYHKARVEELTNG